MFTEGVNFKYCPRAINKLYAYPAIRPELLNIKGLTGTREAVTTWPLNGLGHD